jgi:ComF family protein
VVRRAASNWLQSAGSLAFPWSCVVCGGDGENGPFCPDCRRELIEAVGTVCPRCGAPVGPYARLDQGCSECRGHRLGFDAVVALGPYQGPIRTLCLALKQERNAWLARWLVDLWVEARAAALPIEPGETIRVVPVPLHWWRRWCRGYDQAETLARHLARRLGLATCHALRRVKPTTKLAGLGRTARRKAMKGAFRTRVGASATLAGQTILLVDDILTTGATCGIAARVLKRAGARRVLVAVIGRA